MRGIAALFALLLLGMPAMASPPVQQNGWIIYQDSHSDQTIPCGPMPILLRGSHTDILMKGPCAYVRLEGEHNDIQVELGPAAVFEITGSHNDVNWRQIVPGPRPRLLDQGGGNSFHHDNG